MNDVLNRYYAEQLAYFGDINLIKLSRAETTALPIEIEEAAYATERYMMRAQFLKEQLAKQEAHVEEIYLGLIKFLETQHSALVKAGKTAPLTVSGDAADHLNELLRFHWAAAACICSQGRDITILPVDHLDKTINTIIRRTLAQIINRLKKQQIKNHLDIVEFMEFYISLDPNGAAKRWRRLLRRSLLPVRLK